MAHKATLGSISHGTLRSVDLLERFAWELAYLSNEGDECRILAAQAVAAAAKANDDESAEECEEDSNLTQLVADLIEALNEFAPPYCYFGTHEGDGSDFGFWPCIDSITELPHVADSDEARELGEDAIFVNDHGNVTVFGADGSVLIAIV